MKPKLMIAIPDRFFDQFLENRVVDTLCGRFSAIDRVDPTLMSSGDWQSLFREEPPQALLSGWGTPQLPELASSKLQFVAHTAGAIRHLVSRSMIEQGLWVTNWGDLAAPSVAEHALTLTFATLRRLSHWTRRLQVDRGWSGDDLDEGVSLYGKRVGIHGFGAIARQFVRLISPFDCDIRAYSQGVPSEAFKQNGVTECQSLEALFDGVDVLIEVEALTPATQNSVTAELLARLPAGAAFINVGRGAVVDEAALIDAIRTGRLHVGLDVFETEPLPAGSPLRDLPNVTMTPHIGGPTPDHRRRCGQRAIDGLLQFASGKIPDGLISLDIYDRST